MTITRAHRALLTATLLVGASVAAASEYGCVGLESQTDLQAVEGKYGVIFRINADLRMYHPFSDTTVSQLKALSDALAAQGTTLIYVPIPTKSVTLPEYLPDRAALYGFDLDVATHVHQNILDRLEDAGVTTVDARSAMLGTPADDLAFFKADFHWSARGANQAAEAIAKVLKQQPAYDDLKKTDFETVPLEPEVAFSGMRRILQKKCKKALPEPITMTYRTTLIEDTTASQVGLDLFGPEDEAIPIALLGTSFSDSPINNFPGFLAEHAQLEVVNYAITGGNQFGAMTSYLTSDEFAESRPNFLIWENPIYNNLAQYGDQPMRELIAAAQGNCSIPVDFEMSDDRSSLQMDLSNFELTPAHTLFVDSDKSAGLDANFAFQSRQGFQRIKSISRGARLRRTGRFYMPLTGLWNEGAAQLQIQMSEPFGKSPQVYVCPPFIEVKS